MGCIFSCFGENQNKCNYEKEFIYKLPIVYGMDEISVSSEEFDCKDEGLYETKKLI